MTEPAAAAPGSPGTPGTPGTPGAAAPMPTNVPSWKLLLALGGGGALAGLIIVLFYAWTLPRVEAYKATVLRSALVEVLHDPARCDTLWLIDGVLNERRPAGDSAKGFERVFLGYDAAGKPVGFAIPVAEAGFADLIEMIVGYDPSAHTVLGLKVLANKETPGIADKVFKPGYTSQFAGRGAPLVGVKKSGGDREAAAGKGAVVMVTGATISSRAVIRGINKAIVRWQPLLDAYAARGGKS
jgi:electron transport complex protein RnfG